MSYGFGYAYPRRGRARSAAFDEIIVVAGQSNAITTGISGATGLPSGWSDTDRVQMWNGSAFAAYSPGAAANWGPEAAYAKAWLNDAANDGRTLHIVRHAIAGSQLADTAIHGQSGGSASDWSQTSGELYPAATAKVIAAKAALARPRVTTVLWLQGEADSQEPATVAIYADNAAELYAAIRGDWGDEDTEILACAITDLKAADGYDFEGMLAQQLEVAALSARNHLLDTRGLTFQGDDIHFDEVAINAIGAGFHALAHGGGTEAGWYDPRAVIDIDYDNDRVFVEGTAYASIAAFEAGGDYATVTAVGTTIGYVPVSGYSELTLCFHGVTAAGDPPTGQYAFCLEESGSDTSDMLWMARQVFSAQNSFTLAGFTGGLIAATGGGMALASAQAAGSTECRLAARVKTNDLRYAAGGVIGPQDTDYALPAYQQLTIMNSRGWLASASSSRLWGGTAKRIQMLNVALLDAQLLAKTASLQ